MASYLIPYVDPRKIEGHEDPMLDEFTYGVEEIMLVSEARKNSLITAKYRNPHLKREPVSKYDTLVFGNPLRSFKLKPPFYLTPNILTKLSKPVNLNPHQSEFAAISSALRSWKKLNVNDVDMLLSEIVNLHRQERLKDVYLSNEEILQLVTK